MRAKPSFRLQVRHERERVQASLGGNLRVGRSRNPQYSCWKRFGLNILRFANRPLQKKVVDGIAVVESSAAVDAVDINRQLRRGVLDSHFAIHAVETGG